ncbi:MAG: arginase family protein [Nocardioides sp.]
MCPDHLGPGRRQREPCPCPAPLVAERIALEVAWKKADAVYLSFDIDVFDPSAAPGPGTPDAGGMTSREGLQAAPRHS